MAVDPPKESEELPIAPPLKVVDYRTINKGFGWWSAVVLVESWGRKSIGLYLWQKSSKGWRRKQKFTIRDQGGWEQLVKSVEGFLPQLGQMKT